MRLLRAFFGVRQRFWRLVAAVYGLVNAAAYCCLLPLWEGFDEGYHYGYVQSLADARRLPAIGQANLTREIRRSYELTPVSHYLQPFTKAPMSFTDYFALRADERAGRRRELEAIAPAEKFQPQPGKPNYEAMQPPLPYVFMAAIDGALGDRPLPARVLWLRLACAMAAVLALTHAAWLLAGELGLAEIYATAALFCIFSSQMLYAVLCHICNDAFAVPLLAYLVWVSIRVWRSGAARDWTIAGLVTAAALLTKAYLLFVLPLPAALLLWGYWRRRATVRAVGWFCLPLAVVAGPWYARNLILYHSLSGTVESTSKLTAGGLLRAAWSLPWRESIVYMAHSSLWTGNNSFTTFSSATLNFMLVLLAAGAVAYLARARRQVAEWAVVAAVLLFAGGLALVAVAFYFSSKGAVVAPMPWYAQVLVAPVMLIAFLGMSRLERWGRLGLALYVGAWAYVMLATYFVKLAPLYAGYTGSAKPAALWRWYLESGARRDEILGHTCLASPGVLWTLIGAAAVLALVQAGRLILRAAR